MPGRFHRLPVALGLLALSLPAEAGSWILTTPAYSLIFTDLWHRSDSAIHPTLNTVLDHSEYPLALLGIPVDTAPDLDAESEARAAAALPMQGRPEKTWDSLEIQGGHAFRAAEWRDPSAPAADLRLRVRTYALEKGGILFIAAFRYQTGGCSSHLFTLRAALATLSLNVTSAVRRPQSAGGGPTLSIRPKEGRDALGRLVEASPWVQIFLPRGKFHPGYRSVSKAARLRELPHPLPYHGCSDSPP